MNFFDGFNNNGGCNVGGSCNCLWLLLLLCCCGNNCICDILPLLLILNCCCNNKPHDCGCGCNN
ncbi:MAG: hypothetical protein J6A99_05400 [Clostridia bacterium]|nr:hypothetical protein [Clostridia bacterium]